MAEKKIGEDFVKDMGHRGFRELGAALYSDSNIAQPMYPPRGDRDPPKEPESPTVQEDHSLVLESRMQQVEASKEDPGRDDRGMDRE